MSTTSPDGGNAATPSQSRGPSAAEKASEVSKQVSTQAARVGDTAVEQAKRVSQQTTFQAQSLLDQSKQHLREQAGVQTRQLADAVERLGNQVQALVDGEPEQAGALSAQAQTAAVKLETFAEEIRARGLDGAVREVEHFGRRRPGLFLLGAAVLGFGVGRMVRTGALQQAGHSDSDVRSISYPLSAGPTHELWQDPTRVAPVGTSPVPPLAESEQSAAR